MINDLRKLYARDLAKLRTEVEAYGSAEKLWSVHKGISNSGGNLCLHLIGNLKTYIGNGIGGTPYVRRRDHEFGARNVPVAELLREIDETINVVDDALAGLDPERLKDEFPVIIWEAPTGMTFTLLHLLTHLNYHLGQVNYHRRLVDSRG